MEVKLMRCIYLNQQRENAWSTPAVLSPFCKWLHGNTRVVYLPRAPSSKEQRVEPVPVNIIFYVPRKISQMKQRIRECRRTWRWSLMPTTGNFCPEEKTIYRCNNLVKQESCPTRERYSAVFPHWSTEHVRGQLTCLHKATSSPGLWKKKTWLKQDRKDTFFEDFAITIE